MRKLTIILAICLVTITSALQAQSAEKTAKWLNAKLPAFCINEYLGKTLKSTTTELMQMAQSLEYKNITHISYAHWEETEETPELIELLFVGNFNFGKSFAILLKPSIKEKELKSIIKAFTHIAELNGAKLVKDDL